MAKRRDGGTWEIRTLITNELLEELRREYPHYYDNVRLRMALIEWSNARKAARLDAAERDAQQNELYRAYLAERQAAA